MKKRVRNLISVLLVVAMVLCMHTGVYAEDEEEQEKDVVTLDATNGNAVITNTTDPKDWTGDQMNTLVPAVLFGMTDSHLANGKTVSVSGLYDWEYDVSCNIIPVTGADGYYLFFGYGVPYVHDHLYFINEGIWDVEGAGKIPVVQYDSRKVMYYGKGKSSASKREVMNADIALVKYESGTVKEYGGVEVSNLNMKNNVEANVSYNKIKIGDSLALPKLKELSSFTVKAKVKFAKEDNIDKSVKKCITNTLKNKPFYFGITRRPIGFRLIKTVQSDGAVSENVIKGLGDRVYTNIVVTSMNTKGSKAKANVGFLVSNEDGTKNWVKKIKPSDYTLTAVQAGNYSIAYISGVKNTDNYEYKYYDVITSSELEGYYLCFREKSKKNYTFGIYKADTDMYVDSLEE